MIDQLSATMTIAASGLAAQSMRLRIVSENLANAQSTATRQGGDPYRRKTIVFADELDRLTGIDVVTIQKIRRDTAPFPTEYRPGDPGANQSGYVKLPNVNTIVEMADMREANRSYEANLQVIKQAREMISMTIDLLRGTS